MSENTDLLIESANSEYGIPDIDAWVVSAVAVIEQQERELERLRDALARLESACDARAALLTPEAYIAAESAPGMSDALYELDAARKNARHVLPPNV